MALLSRRQRAFPWLLAASILASAAAVPAHTGGRLRVGHPPDPGAAILARLAEVYVEEVSGFALDLRPYPNADSLLAAFAKGEVDVAVFLPDGEWAGACPAGPEFASFMAARVRDRWHGIWAGSIRRGWEGEPCAAPAVVLSGNVAGDLAYYTLPAYLGKLLDTLTRDGMGRLLPGPASPPRRAIQDFLAQLGLI